MPAYTCPICKLHEGDTEKDYEIARTRLWVLRHHPAPAPLPGWLLLDSYRHIPGPLGFDDREAGEWGSAVRLASQLVQRLTRCERVYAIAFGEGAQHLHLHLVPRHIDNPSTAAWSLADFYRSVEGGRHPAADPALVKQLIAAGREDIRRCHWEQPWASDITVGDLC